MIIDKCRKLYIAVSLILAVFALSTPDAIGQVIHADHAYPISPGVVGWDHYGASVATNGELMAVGAWNAYSIPDHFPEQGFVYIYNADTSDYIRTVYSEDPVPFGQFGYSIDMDEDLLVVGAPETWGGFGPSVGSGNAYLIDAQTGSQLLSFEHADPNLIGGLGQAVAIDNGLVAVWGRTNEPDGTRYGSVFLFDAATGEQVNKFQPAELGEMNLWYGHSLDLENGVLAVNELMIQDGNQVGVVKLYNANTGALIRQLQPESDTSDANFGASISIHNGIVAVSTGAAQPGEDRRGAVYTFDASTGDELVKYTPLCCSFYSISDNADVKIMNGIVAIGFYENTYGGVVHLFDAQTGDLLQILKPRRYGFGFDMFEISIAMGEGVIGVAHDNEDETVGSGGMYFYGPICSPDLTLDDQLDFFDLSAFVNAYAGRHFEADFTNDQILDFFDISAFIDAYTASCQ